MLNTFTFDFISHVKSGRSLILNRTTFILDLGVRGAKRFATVLGQEKKQKTTNVNYVLLFFIEGGFFLSCDTRLPILTLNNFISTQTCCSSSRK
jgi:hypothetical protein